MLISARSRLTTRSVILIGILCDLLLNEHFVANQANSRDNEICDNTIECSGAQTQRCATTSLCWGEQPSTVVALWAGDKVLGHRMSRPRAAHYTHFKRKPTGSYFGTPVPGGNNKTYWLNNSNFIKASKAINWNKYWQNVRHILLNINKKKPLLLLFLPFISKHAYLINTWLI